MTKERYEQVKFCYEVDEESTPAMNISKKARRLAEKCYKKKGEWNDAFSLLWKEIEKCNPDLHEGKFGSVLVSDQLSWFTSENDI